MSLPEWAREERQEWEERNVDGNCSRFRNRFPDDLADT